jgi:hypothetical protein
MLQNISSQYIGLIKGSTSSCEIEELELLRALILYKYRENNLVPFTKQTINNKLVNALKYIWLKNNKSNHSIHTYVDMLYDELEQMGDIICFKQNYITPVQTRLLSLASLENELIGLSEMTMTKNTTTPLSELYILQGCQAVDTLGLKHHATHGAIRLVSLLAQQSSAELPIISLFDWLEKEPPISSSQQSFLSLKYSAINNISIHGRLLKIQDLQIHVPNQRKAVEYIPYSSAIQLSSECLVKVNAIYYERRFILNSSKKELLELSYSQYIRALYWSCFQQQHQLKYTKNTNQKRLECNQITLQNMSD